MCVCVCMCVSVCARTSVRVYFVLMYISFSLLRCRLCQLPPCPDQ